MSHQTQDTFVPHVSEDDLGFSGNWRPMLSSQDDGGPKVSILGKQTKDNDTTGVVMPSHDWSMSPNDPGFLTSVAPHFSRAADPKKTVHFLPNAWGTPWRCYTFQGPASEHIISPSNRSKMIGGGNTPPELLADAFDDIYMFVKRHPRFSQQEKDHYLKKPDFQTDALVPGVERRFFSNMMVQDKVKKSDRLEIVCYTGAAHNYLIEQMRWATRYGTAPIDENWPMYLLGDPTIPSGALVWHLEKLRVGGLQMDSNVMCLTRIPEQLDSMQERRVISPEMLAARVNLYDPNSWNWWSYQEMADFALENWIDVPRDLIAEACGSRATVGQRSAKATVVDGGGAPRSGSVGGDPTPPPRSPVAFVDPTPPPAQVAPLAAQTAPEEELWVSGPVTSGAVVKWKVSEVRAFAASGKLTSEQINVNGVWTPFASAGFSPPPVSPAPPAGPPAPDQPASPLPPAGSPAPDQPAVAAPLVDASLQAKINELVPNYASMPPSKQADVSRVIGAIKLHGDTNPGLPVPQDLAHQLGQILMG